MINPYQVPRETATRYHVARFHELVQELRVCWDALHVPTEQRDAFAALYLKNLDAPSGEDVRTVEWEVARLCRYGELTSNVVACIEARERTLDEIRNASQQKSVDHDNLVRELSDRTRDTEEALAAWSVFNKATAESNTGGHNTTTSSSAPDSFLWYGQDYRVKMKSDVFEVLQPESAKKLTSPSKASAAAVSSSSSPVAARSASNSIDGISGIELDFDVTNTATTTTISPIVSARAVSPPRPPNMTPALVNSVWGKNPYSIGENVYQSLSGVLPESKIPLVYRSPPAKVSKTSSSPERAASPAVGSGAAAVRRHHPNPNAPTYKYTPAAADEPHVDPSEVKRFYVNDMLNEARMELRRAEEEMKLSATRRATRSGSTSIGGVGAAVASPGGAGKGKTTRFSSEFCTDTTTPTQLTNTTSTKITTNATNEEEDPPSQPPPPPPQTPPKTPPRAPDMEEAPVVALSPEWVRKTINKYADSAAITDNSIQTTTGVEFNLTQPVKSPPLPPVVVSDEAAVFRAMNNTLVQAKISDAVWQLCREETLRRLMMQDDEECAWDDVLRDFEFDV
eukprot:PhM_4_TR15549/c0_g2_i1/m.104972